MGPSTYEILMSGIPDGALDALPLKRRSRGPRVLYLQYALRIFCINPNGTDGIFGAGTESALKRYQTRMNLPSDGIANTETWENIRQNILPLQRALQNKGYDTGEADGIATEKLYQAVLQFQTDNELAADGMIGASTKALLLGGTSGEGTISSTQRIGSNGSLTLYLQRILRELGYNIIPNGIFDAETKNAVVAFQAANGLSAYGVVGGGTWNALFARFRIPLTGTGAERLVAAAKFELSWGFREDHGNNITPYGQWYEKNQSLWCAMFVSYCAYQANVLGTLVPRFAWCPSGMSWYQKEKRYFKRDSGYIPKKGDIVFFYSSDKGRVAHVGIVTGGDAQYITTIEGNTLLDCVQLRTYHRNHLTIDGYGNNFGEPIDTPAVPSAEEVETNILEHFSDIIHTAGLLLPS